MLRLSSLDLSGSSIGEATALISGDAAALVEYWESLVCFWLQPVEIAALFGPSPPLPAPRTARGRQRVLCRTPLPPGRSSAFSSGRVLVSHLGLP